MRRLSISLLAALAWAIAVPAGAADEANVTVSHGLSLTGPLKYGPDFKHLEYANPEAPKGGEIKLSAVGGFDSLNPFIIKGQTAAGVTLTFDTLLTNTMDEGSTEYGLVAESVEVPDDLSWAIFNIREEARFHDGTPITADDLIFSLQAVKTKGAPLYRYYYANVERAEKLSEKRIKFHFSGPPNRELPQIVGQLLPVISRQYFETHDFEAASLEPIMGSGPYKVAKVDANRQVVYERVEDYWARDLPINRGRYNFDRIRFDYYRDTTVALEAFKAGQYDYRTENSAKNWATGYDFPAARKGLVRTEEVPHERPTGMQAFAYNIRRPVFQSPELREALIYAFDFEWTNKHIFYGQYTRTESYFSNSVMAAEGEPGEKELEILDPYRDRLPPRVFGPAYEAPETDGSGNPRRNLRAALRILKEAGFEIVDGRLIDPDTNDPVAFEILLVQPSMERVVGPFVQNLERLGVQASMRTVDSAQYTNRVQEYDFDMIVASFPQSSSPGNEQREFWGSAAGNRPGSRNVVGVDNPVIDELIENLIQAPSYDDLIPAVRALDRVLTWNFYVVPQFHARFDRIAYWNKFRRADTDPELGPDIFSWWIDPKLEQNLREGKSSLQED